MLRDMNLVRRTLLSASLLLAVTAMQAQSKSQMRTLVKDQFAFAAKQYKLMAEHTPENKMPQTFNPETGKSTFSNMQWWCSGFYPGSLWLIYEQTGDKEILAEAEKKLKELEPMKHYKGNHDLGFMINCSFGNAFRLTRDASYAKTLDTAAATLALRYRPNVHAIQSWNKNKYFECPVIIDNMMNLELLCWVSSHTGDTSFVHIAKEHANTTMKNHFRPDYSSYHVIDYDPTTGAVRAKKTWQGQSDASSWARGQAWGLYGYTMMYRFTKDKAYLNQAEKIAHYILNDPSMPADMIPYWDYDAPNIPDEPRDASAAAITASGLLELGRYTKGKTRKTFVNAAKKMLVSLSSDNYRAKLGENGDFILMHSTGAKPFKSEVDSPLSYADYYFLEALARYKDWYL